MAKTFQVELGGRVRRLAFHQRDAIALKKRFNETPHRLLFVRTMGLDYEATEPGRVPRMNPAFFDPEVQYAVLHLALVRGGWNVTEDTLIDAIDEAIKKSDGQLGLGDFVVPAVRCAFYSGAVTGSQVDLEARVSDQPDGEQADAGEAGQEGKADSIPAAQV